MSEAGQPEYKSTSRPTTQKYELGSQHQIATHHTATCKKPVDRAPPHHTYETQSNEQKVPRHHAIVIRIAMRLASPAAIDAQDMGLRLGNT
eukprot:366450-Chlamydomonas_euryale.AAC.14